MFLNQVARFGRARFGTCRWTARPSRNPADGRTLEADAISLRKRSIYCVKPITYVRYAILDQSGEQLHRRWVRKTTNVVSLRYSRSYLLRSINTLI
jgi:hypothetical protein